MLADSPVSPVWAHARLANLLQLVISSLVRKSTSFRWGNSHISPDEILSSRSIDFGLEFSNSLKTRKLWAHVDSVRITCLCQSSRVEPLRSLVSVTLSGRLCGRPQINDELDIQLAPMPKSSALSTNNLTRELGWPRADSSKTTTPTTTAT